MKSNLLNKHLNDNLAKLRSLSDIYNKLLTENKVEFRSDVELITADFLKLSDSEQLQYLNRLEFSYQNALGAVNEKYSLIRDKRYVWRTIRNLGATPKSDLLEHITESDYVEIYDNTGIQVFSNFEFCKLVTYSIEEVSFYPWTDLYTRDENTTKQIMTTVERTFFKETGPFKPEIDDHICSENRSNSGREFKVNMKMFSPIQNKVGQNQFLIATSQIKRIT